MEISPVSVKLLRKSINREGVPLTSFLLRYPKPIHTHVLTHREFSRNGSSGRATPAHVSITEVADSNWFPWFVMNERGMIGSEPSDAEETKLRDIWTRAKEAALGFAREMDAAGAHKTHCNDLLFPFAQITVVITGNTFSHFYNQRFHEDARKETWLLAKEMKEIDEVTKPTLLEKGEWHTLFSDDPREDVAICARVSRNKADKTLFTKEENMKLYNRLASTRPFHASCFEHTCENMNDWGRYGNKASYKSMREHFPHEYTGKL